MRIRPRFALALVIGCLLAGGAPLPAQSAPAGQMPDPRQMSGVPLPTADIPPGTVTVRVVRGALSNLVVDHPVEITGDVSASARTNDAGRAEFSGLKPGATLRAVTTVDGERLESQTFTLPAQAGVRLMLVARAPGSPGVSPDDPQPVEGPAQTGAVTLGDQSRFVIEFDDDGLTVFNIYQIVNTSRTPVTPAAPVVFELPDGARSASLLEGSSPLAVAAGDRVTVQGPFAPGPTLVQFAYTMPYDGESVSIEQRLPAPLAQVAVVVQKLGDVRLSSPQISQQREAEAGGQTYVLGQGPALAAGSTFAVELSGLPHAAVWPRYVALGLAFVILAAGGFAAIRGAGPAAGGRERERLEAERERLFAELTRLEDAHRDGSIDQRWYTSRRRELVAALERVYAAMDEAVAA